jgi:phosphate uptake regulator
MNRKVNLVGASTLTVSLPSKWAKFNNVGKGDELDVTEEGSRLILACDSPHREETREFTVQLPEKNIVRYIHNSYRLGVDVIRLNYSQPEVLDVVHNKLHELFGFDVVEQGTNHCTIRNIAVLDNAQFEDSLNRLLNVTLEMVKELHEAVKHKDYAALKAIKGYEKTQNKLFMICARIVNLRSFKGFKHPTIMYLFLHRAEEIADYFKYICEYLDQKRDEVEISKTTLGLFEKAQQMLELLYSFYYKFKQETGEKLVELKEEVFTSHAELLESATPNEAPIIYYLVEAIIRIHEAASPIYALNT